MSHPGIKASVCLLNTRYYWINLKSDVQKRCSECLACQQAKVGKHTQKPVKDLPFPTQRFTHVHMDIVGPLEPLDTNNASNHRYLLTIIDSFTQWFVAIPILDITANTVCQSFLINWVARFELPLYLTTDKGSQFCSELAANLNSILGINHIRTPAYNPCSNNIVKAMFPR